MRQRGIVFYLILGSTMAKALPSIPTNREDWVQRLNVELASPLDKISWKSLGKFLKDPKVLQSLETLDLLKCTAKYRDMVEYRNLMFDPDKTFGLPDYQYYELVENMYPNIFELPPELENGFPSDMEALVRSKSAQG